FRSNPAAELGKVFHRLQELAIRGEINRCGESRAAVSRKLDELLAEATLRLQRDHATAGYSELHRTMSPLNWRRKRNTVIDIATRLMDLAPPPRVGAKRDRVRTISYERLPECGKWAEVQITVPTLRLKGRLDVVEKDEAGVTIRDLK